MRLPLGLLLAAALVALLAAGCTERNTPTDPLNIDTGGNPVSIIIIIGAPTPTPTPSPTPEPE